MKNFFKKNLKFILGFIAGAVLSGSIVYAAIIASSDQVSFSPSNSNWKVSNVKAALDDLYTNAQNNYYTGYNAGKSSVSLSGDALASHVLATKTFYSNSTTKLTGTMTDKGATNYTGTSNTTIAAGYYNGNGQCKLGDAYNSGYDAKYNEINSKFPTKGWKIDGNYLYVTHYNNIDGYIKLKYKFDQEWSSTTFERFGNFSDGYMVPSNSLCHIYEFFVYDANDNALGPVWQVTKSSKKYSIYVAKKDDADTGTIVGDYQGVLNGSVFSVKSLKLVSSF